MKNDTIEVASGYRVDFYYRCGTDGLGRKYKCLMYYKPREGFDFYKVVGHRLYGTFDVTCNMIVIAKDEEDAILQCKNGYGIIADYAHVLPDGREKKYVLSTAKYPN